MSIDRAYIDKTLTRIESRLDEFDECIEAWTARTLDAAPAVTPETQARLARLLAEGDESS